jgi:site-specific recombinase XerD
MKNQKNNCRLNIFKTKKALAKFIRNLSYCKDKTKEAYLYDILNFLSFMQQKQENPRGYLCINEYYLTEWIRSIAPRVGISRLIGILLTVDRFLQAIGNDGLISINPISEFKNRYRKKGWSGIARAFKSTNTECHLESLRINPAFTGCFGNQAKAYIELHRAAGKKYRIPELALIDFNRFLKGLSIDSSKVVTSGLVEEWVNCMDCSQKSCRRKVLVLRQFFHHLVCLGSVEDNPVTDLIIDRIGIPDRFYKPYIFTKKQIRDILHNAQKLSANTQFLLKPQAMFMIVSLLYTLGFRISEALKLRIKDIDFEQNTVFITQTKFYKERLVPFGPKLGKRLKDYLKLRHTVYTPVRKNDLLFVGKKGKQISDVCIRTIFKKIMITVGIIDASTKIKPRLHDLRHSFAVHRLHRWYKEGVDVQKRLVLLSTFMGHFNIKSTQVYLTITDDILKEANKRFHKNFGAFIGKDINYEK